MYTFPTLILYCSLSPGFREESAVINLLREKYLRTISAAITERENCYDVTFRLRGSIRWRFPAKMAQVFMVMGADMAE